VAYAYVQDIASSWEQYELVSAGLVDRPEEELYDTEVDPHELRNLASDPRHGAVLNQLRKAFAEWQRTTDDRLPSARTPDEFDRETGLPLPTRSFERKPPGGR
jgi:hypothetical protein